MRAHAFRREQGFTLTEALVSFGITATGLLAVASFQGDLFSESAYNKARTEALALAQQKIEQFRHYTHADEDNYIDDNDDGTMDADGTYTEDPVTGQNAVFTRSWVLSSGSQAKDIDVTVSWTDSSNVAQSVVLEAAVPWVSPRGGADQIAGFESPILNTPTGRAELGEGELSDFPNPTIYASPTLGGDGLSIYQSDENLLLVDDQNKVLLTLRDACNLTTQQCTTFVKISGTVYMDLVNSTQPLIDTYVIASNAAHCQRWVPDGTLANLPQTDSGDYEWYKYTCYIGGGWHGNIGIITAPDSLQQTDKVCQGDPTAVNASDQPVIALRRAYRGMLYKSYGGQTIYESQGIKDAVTLDGHDFVFTQLDTSMTEGHWCWGLNAPMTRTDSQYGSLFYDVPTDFVCLNADDNNDQTPDYLDAYDTSEWSADIVCPFDPTDPPVSSHRISGFVNVLTYDTSLLSNIGITTSDGSDECVWLTDFTQTSDGVYSAGYACDVFDWGTGWTGYVELQPNSNQLYCPGYQVDFNNITTDQSQGFTCVGVSTIYVTGFYAEGARTVVEGLEISNVDTGTTGYCKIGTNVYQCMLPYEAGSTVNFAVTVFTPDVACGSAEGAYMFYGASADQNPHEQDIVVVARSGLCPLQ